MVQALPPGAHRRAEEAAERAAKVKRITCIHLVRENQVYKLPAANLPLSERRAVLKQLGLSLDAIIASEDITMFVAVAVWLARRLSGERALSWVQFERQWPDDLAEGDVDIWAENTQGQRIDDDGNVIPDPVEVLDVSETETESAVPQS